ncbi:hypothetical protein HMPREF9612_01427 [Cutibacterium acnes HL063PA2]|nr:hypothetical protein HMPREF9612_01427 [Cutibacterium acnes HL063PA2]
MLTAAPDMTRPSRYCRGGRVMMDHDGHYTKQSTPSVRKVPATGRGTDTRVLAEPLRFEEPRKLPAHYAHRASS